MIFKLMRYIIFLLKKGQIFVEKGNNIDLKTTRGSSNKKDMDKSMASDENYSQDEEEITFITNDLLDYSVAKRTFMVDSKEATQVGKT